MGVTLVGFMPCMPGSIVPPPGPICPPVVVELATVPKVVLAAGVPVTDMMLPVKSVTCVATVTLKVLPFCKAKPEILPFWSLLFF